MHCLVVQVIKVSRTIANDRANSGVWVDTMQAWCVQIPGRVRVEGDAGDTGVTFDNTKLPVRSNVKPPSQQALRDGRGGALASAGRGNVFDADYSFDVVSQLINTHPHYRGPDEYPIPALYVVRKSSLVRVQFGQPMLS